MAILLAEDDALLGAGLHSALERAGFEVDWVKDGAAALSLARQKDFDAIVLDIGLPRIAGMDVLRQLRATPSDVPVLILTAQDATSSKVAAFDAGADDYVAKTAELEELIARLRALIRRAGRGSLALGELAMDVVERRVTLRGELLPLSRREFDLLRALMEAGGRVLTRAQLEQVVYVDAQAADSNAIEVHVHNLRGKIGATLLKTVRGVGYMLVGPQR